MKHRGSVLEFATLRNNELMRTFRLTLAEQSFIDIYKVAQIVVNSPCSRFWVSEERATIVISDMLKGRPVLSNMHPLKREMFLEIYHRVLELRKDNRNTRLYNLVFDVVNSPAPKFYLQPRSAIQYIYKIKKGHYRK